jgi:hypothetical protein
VRAGDWYCDTCPSNERGNTGYRYFWTRELAQPPAVSASPVSPMAEPDRDPIVMAAKAMRGMCADALRRAIRATKTLPGTLPLTAEECVVIVENFEIPAVPVLYAQGSESAQSSGPCAQRPPSPAAGEPAETMTPAFSDLSDQTWYCRVCSTINHLILDRCRRCQNPMRAPPTPAPAPEETLAQQAQRNSAAIAGPYALTREQREALLSPVSPEADIIAEQEVRWEREHGYYTEAAKAYEALARIVRAYDRYRGRGVIPAPDEYQTMVQAINDARLIMGPQFQLTDAPPE